MWTPCAIFVFVILAGPSQGYVLNERNGHTIGQQRSSEVQAMGQDQMDPTIQQKESTLDSVGVTIDRKYKRKSRSIDGDLSTTLLNVYLANFDNIKALKIAFLKILSTNIGFLIEEIEKTDVTSALDLPIVDFLIEMLLPLLSGNNNGLGNAFGGKDNFVSDSSNIDANFLQDKSLDTLAIGVMDSKNSTSMDMDPMFEESSSASAT